jgi:hypothetical protein
MTAASPSRRSVLTALAAAPVTGVPALAGAPDPGEPDPVFALIDAARLALERLKRRWKLLPPQNNMPSQ